MIRAALLLCLATPVWAESPLPFDLGGDFVLTDQYGQTRTQADPDGRAQLVFFGYANCPGICSAALPLMADLADTLSAKGANLRPVMITIDPARDTVANMGAPLAKHHPDFIGLTGSDAALQVAYDAFSVEHELAYEDPEHGPIYTHGSLIYLMDGAGKVLTILPPVLDEPTAARIVSTYLLPQG